MNRYLLATTAGAALLLGAGTASADVTVKLGGNAYFDAGYVGGDYASGQRHFEMRNRTRIMVTADYTAPNGLTYGVATRLRLVNNGTVDFDKSWMYVGGAWGQFQMGTKAGPMDDSRVIAPLDWGTGGGIDGAYGAFLSQSGGAFMSDEPSTSGSAINRVMYITPTLSGFQVAVSYAPKSNSGGTNVDLSKASGSGVYQDIYEGRISYNGAFSGATIAADVGYVHGDAGTGIKDLSGYQMGLNVGFSGFMVGGSYVNQGDSGKTANGADQRVFTIGAEYAITPALTIGGQYNQGQGPNATTASSKDKADLWAAGIGYKVAPGFTANLEWDHLKETIAGSSSKKGDAVIFETDMSF